MEPETENTYDLTKKDGSSETGNWSMAADGKTIMLTPRGANSPKSLREVSKEASRVSFQETEISQATGIVIRKFELIPNHWGM